jgi:hypothetical protein
MSDRALTVAALLPADMKFDTQELDLQGGAAWGSSALGFLAAKVQDAIATTLDKDVLELIAEAWANTDELRDVAARPQSAGGVKHVYLAKHDVVCENKLNVVLEFAGAPAITDHLKLLLTAKFEGVGVTLENGCIVAIDAGRGAAKVELRYSNTKLIGSTSDWVALPLKHRLGHPVRVASSREGELTP